MSRCNLQMERQGLRRRAAWLFMVFACGGLLVGGNGNLNARSAAILQREIETLKEQLEFMEVRHETLEAATEQFRLKAKVLKEKSEGEKLKYDTLLASKTQIEETLKEDYQKMHEAEKERLLILEADMKLAGVKYIEASENLEKELSRSELLQSERTKLEESLKQQRMEHDLVLQEKNGLESRLLQAMDEIDSLQTEKIAIKESLDETKRRLEDVMAESNRLDQEQEQTTKKEEDFQRKIKQLLLSIEKRDEELTQSRNMYADLQEQLLAANLRLDELQQDNETQNSSRGEEGDETVIEMDNESLSTATGRSFGLLKSATLYGGKFLQYSWTMVYDAFEAYKKDKARNDTPPSKLQSDKPDDHSYQILESYSKIHASSVEWLNSFASTLHGGEDDTNSWIHTSSLFVKAHCETIILLAEMLLAFLCMDFAVSSLISWWYNTKMGQKRPVKVVGVNYDNVPSSAAGSLLRKTNFGIPNNRSWRDQ